MSTNLRERIEGTYKECMILALYETSGNVSKASEMLGINRMTFHKYLKKFNIRFKEFRKFSRVNKILDGLSTKPLYKEERVD